MPLKHGFAALISEQVIGSSPDWASRFRSPPSDRCCIALADPRLRHRVLTVKVFTCVVAAAMVCLAPARAQISVEVTFDQEQYFANERLLAAVRITNLSGRTLALGTTDDWLDFAVESDDGNVVRQLVDPLPVKGEFDLPNSARATRRVNLAECFEMTRVGRYRVTALVRIPELDFEVVSPRAAVNIVRGTTVWEQTFGMPLKPGDPPGTVEIRRYELVQAMNAKSVQLYLRLSDQSGFKVFKVFPLGPLLTFSRPEGRVDRQGNLHALFQVSARLFTYHVVGPDGEHKIRQTYQYTSSRPRLHTDANAEVSVIGGYRVENDTDLPPPPENSGEAGESESGPETTPPPAAPLNSDAEQRPIGTLSGEPAKVKAGNATRSTPAVAPEPKP